MKLKGTFLPLVIVATISFLMGSTITNRSSSANEQSVQAKQPKATLGAIGTMVFLVHDTEPGSSAEKSGLQSGDLITDLNGKQINSIGDVLALGQQDPGSTVEIQFIRPNFTAGKLESYKGTALLAPIPVEPRQSK